MFSMIDYVVFVRIPTRDDTPLRAL